jgi:tripartite-type tricarboxylate transporter receptor subunit TctC
LAAELFKLTTGTKIVHIAYRGGGPAMNDLLAGHVPMIFNAFTSTLPFIESGKFRAMAIADEKRSPLIPDTPTLTEAGLPGLEMYEWFGMKTDAAKKRLGGQGVELMPQSQAEFAAYIAREIARDRDIINKAGMKAQ